MKWDPANGEWIWKASTATDFWLPFWKTFGWFFSLSINPRANLGAADNFSFSQKTLQRILCKSKVDFVRRNQWVLVYKKRKTALSPANYIILNIVPCVKPTKVLGRFLNTRYEKLVTLCGRNNPSSLTAPGMNLRIVRMNFSNYTTLVYYKLQLT
jgi:hypothetical protein